MVFKLFNVRIKVEYTFFLMLIFSLIASADNLLFVLLFASLHELGHIALLYLLGKKADSITFSYYGIGLKHSAQMTVLEEIAFLSGGCAVNLLFFLLNVKREINFALFVINAMPVYPLDGGRALKLLFGINEKPFKIISLVFLIAFIIFSVYIRNINLILIAVYLAVFSFNEEVR